ncbi:class I SAM-dependent methyltransferase [Nocardia sp. NPDC020380]|uniref:class I SAM-dependent methyltransferase n=1 Tax=Nocardia sp. NPDC020380 TaxID=3364309 RepID=UPI0037A8F16E
MVEASEWKVDESELRTRRAGSFGTVAASYAEHRPDYPEAGIRWALEPARPAGDSPEVLDLGAGTGKLTDGLLALGARVHAVEPDADMRAEFTRLHPDIPIAGGTAESIPLPDNSVDVVVAGQAFHWFDTDRAFPEIARVLRPGGVLAAFWNRDDHSVEWVAGLNQLGRTHVSFQRRANSELPASPLFHPFEQADFPHSQRRTVDSLTATIGTQSHTLVVEPEERVRILAAITDYLRSRPETAEGEFDLPISTLVIRATLA